MILELNAQQKAAIEAPLESPCRVLAGPGSGKTLVLTYRIKYLLENGADPKHIIAVTFSRDMADELLRRTLEICPEVEGTDLQRRLCTIHALTFRLLRAEGDTRQVAREYQIKQAIEQAAEEQDLEIGWKCLYHWINAAKANAVRPGQDEEWYRQIFMDLGVPAFMPWKVSEIRRQFDQIMREQRLLTFPDMIFDVEILFEDNEQIRKKWQDWTHYVLCDEGQDTGFQSMRVLAILAEPQNCIYIVGDIDQAIYYFAGATPDANIGLGFEQRYPDGLTFKLETNYRSTHQIINSVDRLIAQNYGIHNEHLRKVLLPRGNAPEGLPITFAEYDDCYSEALATVAEISNAIGLDSRTPGDYFIGARTRAQLAWLEGPLVRAKIPFVNLAGGSFWASKHAQDVVGCARLVHSRADVEAFQRVYNIASIWMEQPFDLHRDGKLVRKKGEYCSHRWLGKAFLNACGGGYYGMKKVLYSKEGWRYRAGISDLEDFLYHLDGYVERPQALILEIIKSCYRDYLLDQEGLLQGDEAENGKLEDLMTVADVAGQFDDLGGFLDSVAEMVKAAESAKEKDIKDYLVIATNHRLKGAERNVVYGIGWSEGLLPHRFSLEPPPQFDMLPTGGMARIEDERRIGFVCVSRARDEVHLSVVRHYRDRVLVPSRFLAEMGLDLEESRKENNDVGRR